MLIPDRPGHQFQCELSSHGIFAAQICVSIGIQRAVFSYTRGKIPSSVTIKLPLLGRQQ
jgi:hypothetical protein